MIGNWDINDIKKVEVYGWHHWLLVFAGIVRMPLKITFNILWTRVIFLSVWYLLLLQLMNPCLLPEFFDEADQKDKEVVGTSVRLMKLESALIQCEHRASVKGCLWFPTNAVQKRWRPKTFLGGLTSSINIRPLTTMLLSVPNGASLEFDTQSIIQLASFGQILQLHTRMYLIFC